MLYVFQTAHVVFLQRTGKKSTTNYDVVTEPLFCSFNLLFDDVAIAVVVFLNSLMLQQVLAHNFESHVDEPYQTS